MDSGEAETYGYQRKNISVLLLDEENPRLPSKFEGYPQIEIAKFMEKNYNLLPIGRSMVENGFFEDEPLGIIKSGDKYIVIEGNRRLAALKFINYVEYRNNSQYREIWEELAEENTYDLENIPVVLHRSREEIVSIQGFRHIAGTMPWEPRQKARFLYELVDSKGDDFNFKETGIEIGVDEATIRDNYLLYSIYLQAKEEYEIDTKAFEDNFSIFLRALGTRNIQKFINVRKNYDLEYLKHPISEDHADELQELIGYIYGYGKVRRVITDSRQLNNLGKILDSSDALEILRASNDLEKALFAVYGEKQNVESNLKRAEYHLLESFKYIPRHRASEEIFILVKRCSDIITNMLSYFESDEE
ncbi:MAG: hypothetical protein ACTSU6_06685 [Candidatus Njordarchaeales archaeon]